VFWLKQRMHLQYLYWEHIFLSPFNSGQCFSSSEDASCSDWARERFCEAETNNQLAVGRL
jgi:hypothetical protein